MKVAEIKRLNFDTKNRSTIEFNIKRKTLVESKSVVKKKASLKPIERLDISLPEPIVVSIGGTIHNVDKMPKTQFNRVDELIDEVVEVPTILDRVIQTADEKLFGTSENLITTDPLELLVKGIEKATKRETEFYRTTSAERKKIGFKIGKFEFSRSKRI